MDENRIPAEEKKKKRRKKEREKPSPEVQARREAYDWIQSLISALLLCVLVFVFVIRIMDVNGSSMVPTLKNGDKLLVSDLFYEPERGDVVVFKKDDYDPNKALVKRVIAVAGDVVNIDFDNGIVYVNGEAVEEDYIDVTTNNKIDFIGPQTVPENCLFVLGDNRNASTDSRDKRIGMVDKRLVIGKALLVIYPFDEFGAVE